ncbi:MAG: hypothetical protein AAB540_05165 [Patescibacteria group bacterium]
MPLNKVCKICLNPFVWEDADIKNFHKFGFEPFDICSKCMHRQRLAFRNERVFYRRKSDPDGEMVVSLYHPKSPYKVYKSDYYYSGKWDAISYGRGFDFNRPFFEQFYELKLGVPRLAIHNMNAFNSEYCNMSYGNKNSYMIFGGDFNEDSMYGILCDKNKSCLDLDFSYRNELVYFCSDVVDSYGCQFLWNSNNCSQCYFSEDLIGCTECISCSNLRNQSFCIENKKYEKNEYFRKKAQMFTGRHSDFDLMFRRFLEMRGSRIVKYAHNVGCENCVGDYIKNSKNCTKCFDVTDSEDLRDVIYASKAKDCFQCDLIGMGGELGFNSISFFNSRDILFSTVYSVNSYGFKYCETCINSHDLFGCVALGHKEYCILNKQYNENEYKEMAGRIIEHMKKTGEWGQFFPPKVSCFGYNETTANLYFPLVKEEALALGFNWADEVEHQYVPQNYDVPDDIRDVKDDILDAVLGCKGCGGNFKILKQELDFYRRNLIPIPTTCVNCRMKRRSEMRNPREIWKRNCMKCGEAVLSSYDLSRKETVYCEKCYLRNL